MEQRLSLFKKRRDFIKAIPAAALAPAALSAQSESAKAAAPQPKVGAGDSDHVVKAADKASSAGGKVPDWAEHYLTSDMDGTGPDGAPNGQTATFTKIIDTDDIEAFAEVSGDTNPVHLDAEAAEELGLVTFIPDDIDWEDEVRIFLEERASFSPDGLTGMEANLRFAGPETMETKIFGRLTAWQNWIFQRPNAVGDQGALKLYGRPERPSFDYRRT